MRNFMEHMYLGPLFACEMWSLLTIVGKLNPGSRRGNDHNLLATGGLHPNCQLDLPSGPGIAMINCGDSPGRGPPYSRDCWRGRGYGLARRRMGRAGLALGRADGLTLTQP